MNFLIVGDGVEELNWARALLDHPDHRLVTACPGFKELPEVDSTRDFDDALARNNVEAVVVGGDPELRAEALRRVAGAGMPAICLHPPGPNTDPYYQIALSQSETGAIVVPDIPLRLHPGVATLEKDAAAASKPSTMRIEYVVSESAGDLTANVFPRVVDLARALIGEMETVTATGEPPGANPTESLVVHLRGSTGRRGEIRLTRGGYEPLRVIVTGAERTTTLELDPSCLGSAKLIRRTAGQGEEVHEIEPWDPKATILRVLEEAVGGEPRHPDLADGTRAMEVSEAVARALRRGRTIDMVYEEMTEVGNFKSIMTSLGCGLLVGTLVLLLVVATAQGLGFEKAAYLAWAIPPILIVFVFLQFLGFGMRRRGQAVEGDRESGLS